LRFPFFFQVLAGLGVFSLIEMKVKKPSIQKSKTRIAP
jgi:hypothetical protein